MRTLLFIILSIFSIQNISSYYDPYDPNNNGPNLLDQGNRNSQNGNNDRQKNQNKFFDRISEIPIISIVVATIGAGYLTYKGIKKLLGYDNSQENKSPNQIESDGIDVVYIVYDNDQKFTLTKEEYRAYEQVLKEAEIPQSRWRINSNDSRKVPQEEWVAQKKAEARRILLLSKEPRAHGPLPDYQTPNESKAAQEQAISNQQASNDSKPVREQKPEATSAKEEKYLIIHEHFRKDFPEFQDYNKNMRCWIEKVVDPSEVPDRYKKDLITLSRDVFAVHEFNAQELNDYIKEHNLNPSDWNTLYGNEIQKEIHLDSIRLLEQSSHPFKSIWMRENITELVQTIDSGRALNAQGYCTKASKVNNFCAALMDYSTATWGGYVDGVQSRIPETIVQGLMVAGVITAGVFVPGVKEAFLCYSAFQLGVEIGETLGLYCFEGKEAAEAELSEKFKGITDRFKGIHDGTYKLEHSLRDFGRVGGELSADYTLMKSARKLIKGAKKAAQKLRKFYKNRQREFVATTPDGQIFKMIDDSTSNNLRQTKTDQSSRIDQSKNGASKVEWAQDYPKHRPQPRLSWKEIVESTRHGNARYKPGVNIEQLERLGWEQGISVKDGRWKVMDWGKIIGAKNGIETQYSRIEMTTNTIHGHPIPYQEYKNLLKESGIRI